MCEEGNATAVTTSGKHLFSQPHSLFLSSSLLLRSMVYLRAAWELFSFILPLACSLLCMLCRRSRKVCEKLKTQLESSSYSFDVEVLNVHVFWFKCSCLLGCSFRPDHNIFLSFSPLILT